MRRRVRCRPRLLVQYSGLMNVGLARSRYSPIPSRVTLMTQAPGLVTCLKRPTLGLIAFQSSYALRAPCASLITKYLSCVAVGFMPFHDGIMRFESHFVMLRRIEQDVTYFPVFAL